MPIMPTMDDFELTSKVTPMDSGTILDQIVMTPKPPVGHITKVNNIFWGLTIGSKSMTRPGGRLAGACRPNKDSVGLIQLKGFLLSPTMINIY